MELTPRQNEILQLVKENEPITGEQIAEMLGLSRPTIRSDLYVLVMLGFLEAKPKVGYFLGGAAVKDNQMGKRLETLKVKDFQSIPVVVREKSTVHDAVVTLFLENVGSLIVVDDAGNLVGIISRKDLLKVTMGNPTAATMPVSLVMTRHPNIITVTPEDSILHVGKLMIHHQVDSLPVVDKIKDENGQEKTEIVGRITKTTMTKILLELATES